MKIQITARRLKLTEALKKFAEEKALKAQKYFNHIIWAQVTLSVEKRAHQAEIVVHASRQTFRALAQAADLYAALDLASDKIDAQLKKYKERLREHHKADAGAPTEAPPPVLARVSVVKKIPVNPISQEAAVEEMERLGHSFWMFQDAGSRQINVIYRRVDDSYGILQPVKRDAR